MDTFKKLWDFFTAASVAEKIQVGIDGWNQTIEGVLTLLRISPMSFKDGTAWTYVENIYSYVTLIAGSLMAVLILYNLCKTTLDIRQELHLNVLVKDFIIVAIAEGVLLNSMTLIGYIFQIAGALVGLLGISYTPLQAPVILESAKVEFFEGIVAIFVCLAFYILSFMLIYTVYFRFLKIYIILPLASLACATFAGGHEIARIGFTYFKSVLVYAFEVLVIYLAILFGNVLGSSASGIWPDSITWNMLEPVLYAGLVVGAAKGAENILRRTFGM